MSEGFLLTPHMGMVFFRYARRYEKEPNLQWRIAVLRRIIAKHKGKYIRDAETFIEKHNAIRIDKKEPEND